MKRLIAASFATAVSLAADGTETHSFVAARSSARAPTAAFPLLSAASTDAACEIGAAGLIAHDDNLVENGYNYPLQVTDARYVDRFTPSSYPATFSRVCVSLFSDAGVETLDYDIVVYKDDGPGGAPGTLLGTLPVRGGSVYQLLDLPFTPRFHSVDVADLGVNLEAGSAYIGLRWDASQGSADLVYLSADESPATPSAGGYTTANGGAWVPIADGQAGYRALMLRAVSGQGGPRAPWVRAAFAPPRIMNNESSTLTIRLSNVSQPTAAVLTDAFVHELAPGLSLATPPNATTTCDGTLTANAGSGTLSLAGGASIPAAATCTITVDVTGAASGDYVDTIAAGALKTQHGSNIEPAQANLHIGYVFPEPYCDAKFPAEVWPVTHVTFADLDHASDATLAGSPALEDFTAITAHAAPGQVLPMTVEGAGQGTATVSVYVDWNHNGVFSDPGEAYPIGRIVDSDGRDGQKATADIAVPATATGTTRMRVSKVSGGPSEPCNWLGFGQAEDYTLRIGPADQVFADGFDG